MSCLASKEEVEVNPQSGVPTSDLAWKVQSNLSWFAIFLKAFDTFQAFAMFHVKHFL